MVQGRAWGGAYIGRASSGKGGGTGVAVAWTRQEGNFRDVEGWLPPLDGEEPEEMKDAE